MAHNGRKYLAQPRKVSMVEVLHPDTPNAVKRQLTGRPLYLTDYIRVPRLGTHGTYSLEQMATFVKGQRRTGVR